MSEKVDLNNGLSKRPVAFFDIDGTIFRSSLLIELVEKFIEEGIFDSSVKNLYQSSEQAWLNREGTYEEYINNLVKAFVSNLKGVHYGTLADVGKAVVKEQSRHVYRYTRDLLNELKAKNYILIAISQSPKTILDEFCSQYGFDKVYGRIYEIGPQDCFTGLVTDEHLIKNKSYIVKRVLEKNPEFDKENTLAVGDTEGDIPLLESVERAICFNPNQALYNHAKRLNWEVVVERKDVIYEL